MVAWQGRARGVAGSGVGTIIFICDTVYQHNTNFFKFYQDTPYSYLFLACTRTALEIYQRDVIQKIRSNIKV